LCFKEAGGWCAQCSILAVGVSRDWVVCWDRRSASYSNEGVGGLALALLIVLLAVITITLTLARTNSEPWHP